MTLRLAPTPNADFTFELHYFYQPESITVTANGQSWLGTNAENALLYGCLVEAYMFLKGDADLMSQYQLKYQESLDRLEVLAEGYDTTDSYRSGTVRKARS